MLNFKNGEDSVLKIGNLGISRDWVYSPKYVEAMWRKFQQEAPEDYLICSGQVTSLKKLLNQVFSQLDLNLRMHFLIDPSLLWSLDLEIIFGCNSKAKKQMEWKYNYNTSRLIAKLIEVENKWIQGNLSN